MKPEERRIVGKCWLNLAQMYGKEIPQQTLTMMLDAVQDLDTQKMLDAFPRWASTSKLGRYPYPVELRELVEPTADNRDMARETSLRIKQAVTKFGYVNQRDARLFIGEEGWIVVERFGGWVHLCQNLGTEIPEHAFLAQCRDALESQLKLKGAGFDIAQPVIEQAKTQGRISSVVKQLGEVLSLNRGQDAKKDT